MFKYQGVRMYKYVYAYKCLFFNIKDKIGVIHIFVNLFLHNRIKISISFILNLNLTGSGKACSV